MSYRVREVFLSLQGEGIRAGTVAVFVRFVGCNLWNGTEAGRSTSKAPCAHWCDTDFAGGEQLSASDVLARLEELWPKGTDAERWCVLTGGEPMLQVDDVLLRELHEASWCVAIETNGTIAFQGQQVGIDHIVVSPKRGTAWEAGIAAADEVKVVLPGAMVEAEGWTDRELEAFEQLVGWSVDLVVQPQDGPGRVATLERCKQFVLSHPRWRLGLQLHKLLGMR